jgi:uncharacterized membrane protein
VTPQTRARLRGILAAAGAVAYACLAHLSNSAPGVGASALGVALSVGPLAAFALSLAWRSGYRRAALLLGLGAVLGGYRYWPVLAAHYPWVYLAQQAGVYALLGLMFARSLAAGRVPLCSQWAALIHGPLSPELARYTRGVTAAWTLFFALMTATLVLLFVLAPLPVWSAFANFIAFPLVVAMFVAEYLARVWLLPGVHHAGILAGVRAFLGHVSDTPATRGG